MLTAGELTADRTGLQDSPIFEASIINQLGGGKPKAAPSGCLTHQDMIRELIQPYKKRQS